MNNNVTFTGTMTDSKAVKARKRKKKFFAALGVVTAAATGAYLYRRGFGKGAEAMVSKAEAMLSDTTSLGAACGYARARLDDGTLVASSVKEYLSACVDELTERGLMTPGAVTADEIDTISKQMIMAVQQGHQ